MAAQVGQVSTPTASVQQGLQKTTEVNKTDDVVVLLFEEMQQSQQNGHQMPLTIVFVERKVGMSWHHDLSTMLAFLGLFSHSRAGCHIAYPCFCTCRTDPG